MSSIEPTESTERFKLTESFLSKYKDKQPAWGPLGEVVYRRTYSRPLPDGGNEEFWQTLKRVVEGTYNIQKQHCERYRLPWSSQKAARSAQTMYQLMWEFKFLPPGRGLWAMGTEYVERRNNSAPLLNCAFISTEDLATDFSEPFCFMMDFMMVGCGVGADTKGAGSVRIQKPKVGSFTYMVEDSREGWVDLVKTILESYVGGTLRPTEVDYSKVRPLGAPIRGFGGTASGPGPLISLIADIDNVLRPMIGELITSTAIVDIFNLIGRCVVAGNLRRSAELILGEPADEEFLSVKDPAKHSKELAHHRWASNNSVFARVGADYSKLAKQTATNGEPGYFWLENARNYGRLADPPNDLDLHVGGCNPCQPAWATVLAPEGIKTLADICIGDTIWSGESWTKVVRKVCTGTKPVYAFKTRAGIFYGTEQHKVISSGERVEAGDAETIDTAIADYSHHSSSYELIDIMDGLIIGDGSVHKASNNLVYLNIGENDQDYHKQLGPALLEHHPGIKEYAWEVKTSIRAEELPRTFERIVPDRFFYGNQQKVTGFLRGLYSANGSVVGSRVTLKASSLKVIEQTQQMLSSLGIRSYYTINTAHEVRFKNGTYLCRESYDLNITTDRRKFFESIGFLQEYKNKKLAQIVETVGTSNFAHSKPKLSYEVVEKTLLGEESVWDITVTDEGHTYWTGGLLVSNCGEQTLHVGGEACCLVETFPNNHQSIDEYKRTLKFAYLYAKTVTLLPTHNEKTNAVQLKNRRLGISQAGIVQAIEKRGLREHMHWCDEGYKYLKDLDKIYSGWLCIPRSIKISTVKPGGSIPLLCGATPGIHFPHSEYYIRNIRFGKNSPLVRPLKDAGYPTEEDIASPDTTVVSFPIHEQNFSKAKADVSMWEQLELAAQMQHWWSDNAVSITVSLKKEEAKDLPRALELYETRLKSVSFLPLQDHGYAQAPYITISKSRYEELAGRLKPVSFVGISKAIDMDDNYCSGDKCSIEPVKEI